MIRNEFYENISNRKCAFKYATKSGLINLKLKSCSRTNQEGIINIEKGKSRHRFN